MNTPYASGRSPGSAWSEPLGTGGRGAGVIGAGEVVALIRRRRTMIVLVILASMVLLTSAVLSMRDSYSAAALLVLERNDGMLLEAVTEVAGDQRDRSAVETEMDVITSRTMAGRVVTATGLIDHPWFNTYLEDESLPEPRLHRLLDEVKARVLGFLGLSGDDAPRPLPELTVQIDRAITSLLSRISVSRDDESRAITVRVSTPDPELSATLANTVVNTYVDWSREIKRSAANDAVNFLRERSRLIAARIAESERAITDFSRDNQLASEARDDLVRQRIDEMNSQLTTARVELAGIIARRDQGRRVIDGLEGFESMTVASPVLTDLRTQKSSLERERAQYASNFGAMHPDVLKKNAEIASVDGMIDGELRNVLDNFAGEENVVRDRIEQLETQITTLQATVRQRALAEIRLRELQRDLVGDAKLHDLIVARLADLDPFTEIAKPGARVVSVAAVPTSPSFPQKGRIIMGGFIGASVLSIVLALMLEASDTRIRSGRRVAELVRLPNLASLPKASRALDRARMEREFASHPRSVHAEALRGLYLACRAQLPLSKSVILFTAPLPRDRSTQVAFGMACAAAADGVRTVFLDLTPQGRAGEPAEPLNVDAKAVSAPPKGEAPGPVGLRTIRLSQGNGGRPIQTEQVRQMIEKLRGSYDLVVVNSAPVLIVEDANWLAPLVDAAVLVIRYQRTTEQELCDAVSRLKLNRAPLIGTALGGVDSRARSSSETMGALSYPRQAKPYFAG